MFTGPPIITRHPANKVVNITVGTTLSCEATGVNVEYQWEVSSIDEEQWERFYGITSASFSFHSATSKKYRCIAFNEAGRTISNASTVTFVGKLLYHQ